MVEINDIPKYIRYDFFISLIGLLIIYLSFSEALLRDPSLFIFSIVVGSFFLGFGLTKMKKNYKEELKVESKRKELQLNKIKLENKVTNLNIASLRVKALKSSLLEKRLRQKKKKIKN